MNRALILTAIPLESDAVVHHLKEPREETHPKGTIYTVGKFQAAEVEWEVAVVRTGQGNSRTAQEAERAIAHFQPGIAMFVGVAGGRKDVQLGDVVAADKVYGYESGKDTASGFLPRPDVFHASYRMYQRALAESSRTDWRSRIEPRQRTGEPSVFIKPIASGEKLVASSQSLVAELLGHSYSDALAVEMEGYGFAKALQANPEVECLVIRGISDCLDDKNKPSDAAAQARAAANAAAFAFEMLSKLGAAPTRAPSSPQVDAPTQTTRQLGDVELILINESPEHERVEALIQKLLEHPATQPRSERTTVPSHKLIVEFHPGVQGRLSLVMRLRDVAEPKDAPMSLDLIVSEEDLPVLAGALEAARFIATANPHAAMQKLLALIQDNGIADRIRNVLLYEATTLNLKHALERSLELGELLLGIDKIEPWVVSLISLNLMSDLQRLGAIGNAEGQTRVSQRLRDVSFKAMSTGAAGIEAFYGVARQTEPPRLAISLYHELARQHPPYASRWYWHRDLGTFHYELGEREKAAEHYDKAALLKENYSRLYRYAGDAYFYRGEWGDAAQRYRKALSLEPMERFFVKTKLALCEYQISRGIGREPSTPKRRQLAWKLASAGEWLFDHGLPSLSWPLFWLSVWLTPLADLGAKYLALRANRKGRPQEAIRWLKLALCCRPDNPVTWLNATVNMLTLSRGHWNKESRTHAEAALFYGGPQVLDRLHLQLVNTPNRDQLVAELKDEVLGKVLLERQAWYERQAKLLAPERFGGVDHWEFPDGL